MSCAVIAFPPEWGTYINAGIGDARLPQNTGEGNDYGRYAPSTVKRLTDAPVAGVALPADAEYAMFVVLDGAVNIRTSMLTDASATEGFTIFQDTVFIPPPGRAFLEALSFVDVSTASDFRVIYGRKS